MIVWNVLMQRRVVPRLGALGPHHPHQRHRAAGAAAPRPRLQPQHRPHQGGQAVPAPRHHRMGRRMGARRLPPHPHPQPGAHGRAEVSLFACICINI